MARLYTLFVYEDRNEYESRERIYRNRCDAFSLDDQSFKDLFRLKKGTARILCDELNFLQPRSGVRTVMSLETQVLCSLRFFATGSYQRAVGQDLMLALSQASVSRCIKRVSQAMNDVLLKKIISFPPASEYPNIKRNFMSNTRFPGVIGAVDCTHIAIIAPPTPLEDSYVNRKGYHSINVQLVCDTDCKILNINAKHPGRSHDAFIWRNCCLRDILHEESISMNEQNCWLLGDSGYPLEPWLMTPIMCPSTAAERRYNVAHSAARSNIERCNGLLKSRFRCLSKHRVLNYDPTTASKIINACAILHNICIIANDHYDGENSDSDSDEDDDESYEDNSSNQNYVHASLLRRRLINNHFS